MHVINAAAAVQGLSLDIASVHAACSIVATPTPFFSSGGKDLGVGKS